MAPRLLLAATFASLLIISSTQAAFAATELKYDDGEADTGSAPSTGAYYAVRFSLPPGWPRAKLIRARFYKVPSFDATPVRIHVFASDGATELTSPFQVDILSENAWNDADLSSRNIIVTGDFYVAFEWLRDFDPFLGIDTDSPDGRSCQKDNAEGSWVAPEGEDYMIRAVIDHVTVGGCIIPMSVLGVLTPYLAAIALVAVAATVYVTKYER